MISAGPDSSPQPPAGTPGPLPFMKTMDDALAVCVKEQDNFYVDAFMFEAWLGELVCRVAAEYADNKSANTRGSPSP